jgi:hypothetical protein
MAMTWDEVAQQDSYLQLSGEQKLEARNQYFDSVVAPQIPIEYNDEQRTGVRQEFLNYASSLDPKTIVPVALTSEAAVNTSIEEVGPPVWEDVASKPEFQALDSKGKAEAMHQYFNEVISPQIPDSVSAKQYEETKLQFITNAVKGETGEAPINETRSGLPFNKGIEALAAEKGINPNIIHAIINRESQYDENATGEVGEWGLMQIKPDTAKDLGLTPENAYDPEANVRAGTTYFLQLYDKYDGDLRKALAAYNWGQGNVDRKGLEEMPESTKEYIENITNRFNELNAQEGTQLDLTVDAEGKFRFGGDKLGKKTTERTKGELIQAMNHDPLSIVDEDAALVFGEGVPESTGIYVEKPMVAEESMSLADLLKEEAEDLPTEGYTSRNLPDIDVGKGLNTVGVMIKGKPWDGGDWLHRETVQSTINYGAGFLAGVSRSSEKMNEKLAKFAGVLDQGAERVSDYTGYEKGNLFRGLKSFFEEGAEQNKAGTEFWKQYIKNPSFTEQVVEAVGEAPMAVADFYMGPLWAGASGAVEGGAVEGLKSMAHWYLFKGILDGANTLKPTLRTAALAGVGGVDAAAQGASGHEIAKSAAVMGLLGLAGGRGRKGVKDVVRDFDSAYGKAIAENKYLRKLENTVVKHTPDPVKDVLNKSKNELVRVTLDRFDPLKRYVPYTYLKARTIQKYLDQSVVKLDDLKYRLNKYKVDASRDSVTIFSDAVLAEQIHNRVRRKIPTGDWTLKEAKEARKATREQWERQGGKGSDLDNAIKEWHKFTRKEILDPMYENGLIDKAFYDNITKSNDFYATFKLAEMLPETSADFAGFKKAKFDVVSQEVVKTAQGLEGKIKDPIEATLETFFRAQETIARNEVARNLAKELPTDSIRRVVSNPKEYKQRLKDYDDTIQMEIDREIRDIKSNIETEMAKEPVLRDREELYKLNNELVDAKRWKTNPEDFIQLRNELYTAEIQRPSAFNAFDRQRLPVKPIRKGAFDKKEWDLLHYLEQGRKQTYLVPKALAKTMKQLDQFPKVPKFVQTMTDIFRRSATTANPPFLLSNAFRDGWLAWFTSPVHKWYYFGTDFAADYAGSIPDALRQVSAQRDLIRDKMGYRISPTDTWVEFINTGSPMGWTGAEIKASAKKAQRLFRHSRKVKLNSGKVAIEHIIDLTGKAWRQTGGWLEDANEIVEMTSRLAMFKKGRQLQDSLIYEEGSPYLSNKFKKHLPSEFQELPPHIQSIKIQEYVKQYLDALQSRNPRRGQNAVVGEVMREVDLDLAMLGRDATIDFNRAGSLVRVLNHWIPFLNASVQGSATMLRSMFKKNINPLTNKRNRANTWMKLASISTALMALAEWNKLVDPTGELWADIKDRDKQNNFIILVSAKVDEAKLKELVASGMSAPEAERLLRASGDVIPEFIKAPKGEVGQLVNPLQRLIYEGYDSAKDVYNEMLSLTSNISPIEFIDEDGNFSTKKIISKLLPPLSKAGIEPATNTNLFFGSPIESAKLQKLPASQRFRASTPEKYVKLSAFLSEKFGVELSPLMTQNVMSNILTMYGRDAILNPFDVKDWEKLAGRMVERLYSTKGGAKQNKFWSMKEDIQKDYDALRNQAKQLIQKDRVEEAIELLRTWNEEVPSRIDEIGKRLGPKYEDQGGLIRKFLFTDRKAENLFIQDDRSYVDKTRQGRQ